MWEFDDRSIFLLRGGGPWESGNCPILRPCGGESWESNKHTILLPYNGGPWESDNHLILTPLWWRAMRIGQLLNSHSIGMGRGEDWTIVWFSFCCNGGRWKLDVHLIIIPLPWQDVKIELLRISYKFWPLFFPRFFLLEDGEGFWEFLRWMSLFVSLECEMWMLLGWGLKFWRLEIQLIFCTW